MTKKFRRTLSLLLTLCMIASVFTVSVVSVSAAEPYTYTVVSKEDKTARLTSYTGTAVTELVLPSVIDGYTVVEIGPGCFNANNASSPVRNLKKVTIPNTVTTIGTNAFLLTKLEEIRIPASVKTIGNRAFMVESRLWIKAYIPNETVSIGEQAFGYDINRNKLEGFTIYSSSEAAISYAEENGINIENPEFNYSIIDDTDKTLKITGSSYSKEDFNIPETYFGYTVTSIGARAFHNRATMYRVTLPDTVSVVEEFAFYQTPLEYYNVPNSITEIGRYAFFLKYDGEHALPKEATIPKSITKIGEYGIGYPWLPGAFTIKGYRNTVAQTYAENNGYNFIPLDPWDYAVTSERFSIARITGYYGADTEISIPSEIDGYSIYTISENTFKDNTAIVSVTIPDSVTTIGAGAFYGCTSLKDITIPSSVTTINDKALGYFTNASNKEEVYDLTVRCYRGSAAHTYAKENKLDYILLDENPWDYNILNLARQTVEITGYRGADRDTKEIYEIPSDIDGNKVIRIAAMAFMNNTAIKELVIPADIGTIDTAAFFGCTSLSKVTIPYNVSSISHGAFQGCVNLKEITIPSSVVSIGDMALGYLADADHTKVDGFTIYGYNGTAAQEYALNRGFNFVSLDPPEPLIEGDYEYRLTDDEDAAIIVRYLGNDKIVEIPKELAGYTVTEIDDWAFSDMPEAETVVIPESITKIGDSAFIACDNLKTVEILNKDVVIGKCALGFNEETGKNSPFIIIGYTASTAEKYAEENEFIFVDINSKSDFTFVFLEDGTIEITGYNGNARELEIPSEIYGIKVSSIGSRAFISNTEITELTISGSIKSIGESAFNSCSSLRTLILKNGVNEIGKSAFMFCKKLNSVSFPPSLRTIGAYAFEDTGLSSVTVPKGVTEIGNYALGTTMSNQSGKVFDFKIYGYSGTAAQDYADKYDFEFIPLDDSANEVGDIDGDGEINVKDATEIMKHTVNIGTLTDEQLAAADVNNDKEVNVKDATEIMKYTVKLSSVFDDIA